MKILMVNKFLYPHGGSETYLFDLGKQLTENGHEVQYFGMENQNRVLGNRVESYTSSMDFHGTGFAKLLYPFKIIYSIEARKKIRLVLEDFNPDVVHLNNINFQLTPSIIHEIRKWEKEKKKKVKIVSTAHDAQWICPNHLLMIPGTKERCLKCQNGNYIECTKNKCIHGSAVKSFLGTMEAILYKKLKIYQKVDVIICPSEFLRKVLSSNPDIAERLVVLHNYCSVNLTHTYEKKNYVLYFGRYSEEKGMEVLLEACRRLKEVSFVFAGSGEYEAQIKQLPNVKQTGFLTGEELKKVIAQAKVVVAPSIWYENCPFSVIEALSLGTPVIGSELGGIPELIDEGKTGKLFPPGDTEALCGHIREFWEDNELCQRYSENCRHHSFDSLEEYCRKLVELYHC